VLPTEQVMPEFLIENRRSVKKQALQRNSFLEKNRKG
jgi:hypothetical protein